jgi:hypothetical protein
MDSTYGCVQDELAYQVLKEKCLGGKVWDIVGNIEDPTELLSCPLLL